MSHFMSNNGGGANNTHNCISVEKFFFYFFRYLISFSSFIRRRNNFPLFWSKGIDGPVVVLLGTAQQHLMIEFNGVQGPVYLFLTHRREKKKETPKFLSQHQSPPHSLRLLLAPYLLKEQKDEKSLFSFSFFKIKDRYVITNGQQRIAPF